MATQPTPLVKNRFSPRQSCITPPGEGQAQQQFTKLCDINHIMAKFDKSGFLTHTNVKQPAYDYVPATTLHEAMNLVTSANNMFAELDPAIRNKFSNNPEELFEFVNNPDNKSEAIELGLIPGEFSEPSIPEIIQEKEAISEDEPTE